MTRAEQLTFCKRCTNRKMDMKTGLICKLTGEKADFENECDTFALDESVIIRVDDTEAIEHNTVLGKLSPHNLDRFKGEQKYIPALITGSIVGLIGALVWGAVTVVTGYQIGYLAIAIGAAVGFSIRYIGKGIEPIFGITGGVIAILSCLLGNFFSIIGFIADSESLSYFQTLILFDYSFLIEIMTETFSPIDILFYGIAAFEGYKFSFRSFTEKDLYELEK